MDTRIPPDAGTGTTTGVQSNTTSTGTSSGATDILQPEVARPYKDPSADRILGREPLTSDSSTDRSSDTTNEWLKPGFIQQLSEDDARMENERAAEKIKQKLKPLSKLNAVRRSFAHSPPHNDHPQVHPVSLDPPATIPTDSHPSPDSNSTNPVESTSAVHQGKDEEEDEEEEGGKKSRRASARESTLGAKQQPGKSDARSAMLIDLEPARLVDAQTVAGDRRYFQCPGDPEPEGDYVYDFLYQHQRGAFFLGTPKFSSKSLLPVDPDEWTDPSFQTSPMDTSDFELPDPSWEWVHKSWLVDMTGDVDEDGWEYAMTFHGSPWHGNYEVFRSFARRRRWLRLRKRKVIPDTILGWL